MSEHGGVARATYLRMASELDWTSFTEAHRSRCLDQAVKAGDDDRKDRSGRKRGRGGKSKREGNKDGRDRDNERAGKGGKQGEKQGGKN